MHLFYHKRHRLRFVLCVLNKYRYIIKHVLRITRLNLVVMAIVFIIRQGEAMLSGFLSYMGVLALQAVFFVAAGLVPWILLLCTLFVAWIRKDAARSKLLVRANILLGLTIGYATFTLQNDTLNTMALVGYGLTVSLLTVLWLMRTIGLGLSMLFRRPRMQDAHIRDA